MPDELGQLLDTLGRTSPAAPPPPAFLAAVARRRHRRRLVHAATGAGVFAVLLGATLVLRMPPSTAPGGPNLAEGPDGPDVVLVAGAAPATLANLTRLNAEPGVEELVLPASHGGGVAKPLHIGSAWDARAVEKLMTN